MQLELWNGARGDREKAVLERMEVLIPKLPIDEPTWTDACDLARRAREAGLTIPTNDILIVACARRHDLEIEHCDQHIGALLGLA